MIKLIVIRNLLIIILFLFVQFALCQNNSSPKTVEDHIELCKTNLDNNNPLEAVKFGEKAVGLDDKNADAHYWLGEAYVLSMSEISKWKILSQIKKAKKEWKRAAELDDKHIKTRESLIKFHLFAPGLMGGDKEKAKLLADEIYIVDSLKGRLAFGLIYERNEEYAKAEAEYQKVVKADPNMFQGYLRSGNLYLKLERYDEARQMYQNALKIEPDNFTIYYHLGDCALKSGLDLESGIKYFELYLEKEPQMLVELKALVHCNIGKIYFKLNDTVNAKNEYNIALKLDPNNKQAKKALKELE